MVDKIQAFLIFCEDVRTEEGDKPMILGILSPQFYISEPYDVMDNIKLVTFLTAPFDQDSIDLRLVVIMDSEDYEKGEKTYAQTVARPADAIEGDAWSAVLTTHLLVPPWKNGSVVEGYLNAGGVEATARIRCTVLAEET